MNRLTKMTLTMILALSCGLADVTPASAAEPLSLAQAAAMLAQKRQPSAATPAAPPACVQNVGIFSVHAANHAGRFTATEHNEGNLLRARTPRPSNGNLGPWERFELCENIDTGVLHIRSMSANLYVAVELNERNLLRARTPKNALGSWEEFRMDRIPGSYNYFLYSFAARAFVATEMNEANLLRARTPGTQLGEWELFR